MPVKAYSPIQEIKAGKRLEHWMFQAAPPYKFKNKSELHAYLKKVANQYKLPAKLLKRIVAVESSNCRARVNTLTHDYGCMQLNVKTIKLYGWNQDSIVKNDMLNVVAAAIILKDFQKTFQKREPDSWPCRYNIGYRKLPATCATYLTKLASVEL